MMKMLLAMMVVGVFLKLNSWEDYRGEGGGIRSLLGGTLIFIGFFYFVFIGLFTLASII